MKTRKHNERPVERCNGTALRKASRYLSQFYDAAIAPSGLRGTQKAILATIDRAGPISMGKLADELLIDRSALSQNMKLLEREGLVVVSADLKDGRAKLVSLTDYGRERHAVAHPLWEAAQKRFEETYGAEDALQLRHLMARITNLEL
ncbi:MarR family winged helix-turn-helix transcriptional regulator [Microvirga flavescens]|uniref:MarR family winged helix-turn-helix transcriptional regulator n=1 Tax=Microvirga flavescens TaxID=2249811 RepID=UPI001FDF791C|nr:MarR family winged helix-turn-helix transcriptional regulator [Microvirga flavescens]